MFSSDDACLVLKKIVLPGKKHLFVVFSAEGGCFLLFSFSSNKKRREALSFIEPLSFLRPASLRPLKKGGFRLDDFDICFSPSFEIKQKRLPLLLLISEILSSTIKVGYKNPALFLFLKKSVLSLAREPFSPAFLLVFLLSFAKHLGFSCKKNAFLGDDCFFSLEEGSLRNTKSPFSVALSKKQANLFYILLGTTFDTVSSVVIKKIDRHFFLDVIFDYYSFHIEGFRQPKSIAVLKELYNV